MKKLENIEGVNNLTKKQQKEITGGYVPTLYQFCCTQTQESWIKAYPFLADDPYFDCSTIVC